MEHVAIVTGSAFVYFPAKLGKNTNPPEQEDQTEAEFQVLSDSPVDRHTYNEHSTISWFFLFWLVLHLFSTTSVIYNIHNKPSWCHDHHYYVRSGSEGNSKLNIMKTMISNVMLSWQIFSWSTYQCRHFIVYWTLGAKKGRTGWRRPFVIDLCCSPRFSWCYHGKVGAIPRFIRCILQRSLLCTLDWARFSTH